MRLILAVLAPLFTMLFLCDLGASSSPAEKKRRQAGSAVGSRCLTEPSRQSGSCLMPSRCRRLLASGNSRMSENALRRGNCARRRRVCCPDRTTMDNLSTTDCGEQRNAFTPSILGGRAALDGEWPWMVSLSTGNGHECGAVLISPRHVLTAAHCIIDSRGRDLPATRLGVRLGLLDLRQRSPEVTVDRVTRHPNFNMTVFRADLAVLRLRQPGSVPGRKVGPICLPIRERVAPLEGKYAAVAGWGDNREGGNGSHILQTLGSLPIWNRSRCASAYRGLLPITEGLFCAGFESGRRDSCQGDSGGPLMWFDPTSQRFSLVGIVSTGLGCGRRGFPGIYTDVLVYLPWIRQQLDN